MATDKGLEDVPESEYFLLPPLARYLSRPFGLRSGAQEPMDCAVRKKKALWIDRRTEAQIPVPPLIGRIYHLQQSRTQLTAMRPYRPDRVQLR